MSDADRLVRRIDRRRLDELLIQAVDAYTPSHREEQAAEVFAEALTAAGVPHLIQPVPSKLGGEERGNLIVELGPRPPAMMLVGHLDTIPILDETRQRRRRQGDLLYGLGTADMKGGCAAMIEAVGALARAGVEPARGLVVALVVGEEEYGDGTEALLERYQAPLVVLGEPTALVPCLDHYGYLEYRLAGRGNEAHSALPEVGASAIHAMLTWLTRLLELVRAAPFAADVAINPREIRGGGELFLVAERCEAELDVHVAPGVAERDVRELVERARRRAVSDHAGCRLELEKVFQADPYAIDPDHADLAPVRRAFEEAGLGWSPGTFRSHSDGSVFFGAGSLPVVCGPGRLEVAHTRDEHVSLDEVARAAQLYATLIHRLCCP